MKTKQEIIDILMSELNYIYCFNCIGNEGKYEGCEDCNRKMMGWSISPKTAKNIANKILE